MTIFARLRRAAPLVFVIAMSVLLRADFKQDFAEGFKAFNVRSYPAAATAFRKAIAAKGDDTGEQINIASNQFEPYLPHFFLGMTLFRQQNCIDALQEFTASEKAGKVQTSKYKDTYREAKFNCAGRVPTPTPTATPPATPSPAPVDPVALAKALTDADDAIKRAESADAALDPFAAAQTLASEWSSAPSLGPARANGRKLLADARSSYAQGRDDKDLKGLGSALSTASNAADQLGLVKQSAELRVKQIEAAQREALNRSATGATPTPAPTTTPAAATPSPTAGPASGSAPGRGAVDVDPDLLAIVDAYLNADHAGVITRVARLRNSVPRTAFQSQLFAAASKYALFLRGGEQDTALEADARQYVQTCRKLQPGFQPDARMFSPRFLAFYQAVK